MTVSLICKAVIKDAKKVNIEEIIFLFRISIEIINRDQINFIRDIPSQGDVPSFKAISENLKTISKSMKDDKIWAWKISFYLVDGSKAYRHNKIIKKKTLPHQFKDWIYVGCKIKKQAIYNCKNFQKLMSVAPKLLNCQVNMTSC